ncbi:MAG TPA: YidC/Oxa1 family membrane protein insertase [Patescibacteria group bacterium]|nr:YidC/Oxa1 family membrane protein insertase [Patescibacteria group bacterium]
MFQILAQPILNVLILFYKIFFSNLGLATIALTALVRLLLIPLTNPQMKSAQKIQELGPEMEKIKTKFGKNKQKLMQAQMELYKKHGINPTAGCLPQILNFAILISMFQVFNQVMRAGASAAETLNRSLYSFAQLPPNSTFNFQFLFFDLSRPDLIQIPGFVALPGILAILATVFQFLSSKMMMPVVKVQEKGAKATETQSDDISTMMQKQMLYFFPLMTLILAYTMPSGVMLYWLIFSLFTLLQQWLVNRYVNKGKMITETSHE